MDDGIHYLRNISVLLIGTVKSFRFLKGELVWSLTKGGIISKLYSVNILFIALYIKVSFSYLRLIANEGRP